MISHLIMRLIRTGYDKSLEPVEWARVRVLNVMLFVILITGIVAVIVLLLVGQIFQVLAAATAMLVFALGLYLNHKGRFKLARRLTIGAMVGAIFIVSLLQTGKLSIIHGEDHFFWIMALTLLLMEGAKRKLIYWGLFLILCALKYYKLAGHTDFDILVSLLVKNLAIGVILYYLLHAFSGIFRYNLIRLRRQEIELHSLIDNIPMFIGLLNKEGKFKILNRRYVELLQRPKHELVGTDLEGLLPQEAYENQVRLFNETLKTGDQQTFHISKELKSGINHSYGKFSPVIEDGELKGVTLYVENISELERTKDELRQANDDKTKLISLIAHDIRGPLAEMDAVIELAKMKGISSEKMEQFLDVIHKKFDPLKNNMRNLLNWAVTQLSDRPPNKQDFDPQELISDLKEINSNSVEGKELKIVISNSLTSVRLDKDLIQIALSNLISNAIKFSPLGGQIEVELFEKNNKWIFKVSDHGSGMTLDQINAFNAARMIPSQQGTVGEKGTGIGLSLVSELVQKNDGEIRLESSENGTTFTLLFPIND